MARVSYTAPDGELAWFDRDKATLVAENDTDWDGQNTVSRATGSQWVSEDLYRTAGGAWVIQRDNRDGRHGATVGVTWHGITDAQAQEWLRRQDLHEEADRYFGEVEERRPGRPEIGGRVTIAVGEDLLARVDADADRLGLTRAQWLRDAAEGRLRQASVDR